MQKYFAIASIVGVAVVTGVILLLSRQLSMTGDNVPLSEDRLVLSSLI